MQSGTKISKCVILIFKGDAMFKYTRAAISQIVDDVKKYCRFFKICSLIFTSTYFIYALISKTGFLAVNIILATLFITYSIFELITINKNIKYVKRFVKRSYNWIKIILKAFTLASTIYGIYLTTTNVSPISIIIATLMTIVWVLQLLLEIVIEIIENKVDLLTHAYNQDITDIKCTLKKPITIVTDKIKKIRGKEISPPPEKHKTIQKLDKRINSPKEMKNNEKQSNKLLFTKKRKQKRSGGNYE